MERGARTPALEEQPEPFEDVLHVWRGFFELHGSRGAGMAGPLPIAWTEIEAYCRLNAIPDPDEFARLIREMDAEFLEWAHKKDGENGGSESRD